MRAPKHAYSYARLKRFKNTYARRPQQIPHMRSLITSQIDLVGTNPGARRMVPLGIHPNCIIYCFLHMLSILVLVFLSCNMHGATLRAKRGFILCATAQKVMRDGPVALAALSLHLSFSGWPHGPTCHTPEMQYVLCANELGVRKTMYFTVLDSINLMRDCSDVKLCFSKVCVLPSSAPKMLCASPGFFFTVMRDCKGITNLVCWPLNCCW